MLTETKENEESNVYIAILSKRLRTLRKRILKIEKYESEANTRKLNEDQLMAVQKKDEVNTLIKELEELINQMRDKDAEVCHYKSTFDIVLFLCLSKF